MNNVQLIGRITKDPEVKTFGKGKDSVDLCRFTLAVRDGKDREGNEIQGDYMLGGGTFDPCKSLNSYAMTDKTLWPSKLEVSVDGKVIGKYDLADDPADHRGILSWGSQTKERWMREAGSYGELVKMAVPASLLKGKKQVVIRFTTPADDLDGGLALYGKDFGRYPLDPTLVLKY